MKLDPNRTWKLVEKRLADERDPTLRRNLELVLAHAFLAFRADDLAERLCAVGVPAQLLVNAHRVMPHPQLEHRAYYQTLEHPHTGRARYPGLPYVGLADGRPRRPPPTLGQHNREVLAGELGIAEEELARWERDAIIGTQPAWIRAARGEKS